MTAAQRTVFIPILAAFTYLALSIDQALYEATGLLPLYSQIAVMGLGIAGIVTLAATNQLGGSLNSSGSAVIIMMFALYTLWTAISFLYSFNDGIAVDFLITRVKFSLFLIIATIILQNEKTRSWFEIVSIGIVGLGVALCILDFIQPTFSSVPGRAAGFYINPNDAGAALVFFGLVASRRLPAGGNLLLWAAASIGILLTFSRGSWLMLIVALFGLALAGRLGGGRARFIFVGFVAAVFLLIFAAYISGDLYLMIVRSPIAELLDENTLARLGSRGLDLDDYSSIEREAVFALGLSRFAASPFLGFGVGSTLSWEESVGTHNMLVMLGAELGILGVVFYLALFIFLFVRSQGTVRILVIALFLAGMTNHNQFDTISLVFPLAYAAAALGPARTALRVARGIQPRRAAPGWQPGRRA